MFKRFLKNTFSKKRFDDFWNQIKDNENIDSSLKIITEKFISSNSYKFVSNQWHFFNILSYKAILEKGLDKYGSNISTHYFTFKDYENDYLENLFNGNEVFDKTINRDLLKKHSNFNNKQSMLYNILCYLLYANLKNSNYYKYLDLLNDKTYLGYDDPHINIEGNKISSDKILSLFDFEKIEKFHYFKENDRILEIGSGSGRLSECVLSIKKNLNYTICEIPPSIYISFKRLKKAFPNKKIELLIDCVSADDLNKKIDQNDISLIFPHQLSFLNKKFFNLAIAVDCLHEMDKKTIKRYFENIDKNSNKMYFSIWKKTKNWNSASLFKKTERLDFDKGDYPVPVSWKLSIKESLRFPSTYYGIGYEIDH